MNPDDPSAAQVIVAEYARLLEQHHEAQAHPASVHSLPYPKQTLKRAIYTSLVSLTASGQLTDDLVEFLETLYVSLADYVDDELATLMREYRAAGDSLTQEAREDKQQSNAWQSVATSSRLVGGIAREIARDGQELRQEFSAMLEGARA